MDKEKSLVLVMLWICIAVSFITATALVQMTTVKVACYEAAKVNTNLKCE